jgi:hypothetical protein
MLGEAGTGAGMAIVLGNTLDTIPGGLVIAAKFSGFETLSFTLMLGMFLGGIPEAAASAAMLTTAGYRACAIFGLWSIVVVAGAAAAVAGKAFVGSSDALMAIFSQALAGGAILAVIAHAMIPEAIDKGGLLVVLPTVGGFLFALFLALDGRALRIALNLHVVWVKVVHAGGCFAHAYCYDALFEQTPGIKSAISSVVDVGPADDSGGGDLLAPQWQMNLSVVGKNSLPPLFEL